MPGPMQKALCFSPDPVRVLRLDAGWFSPLPPEPCPEKERAQRREVTLQKAPGTEGQAGTGTSSSLPRWVVSSALGAPASHTAVLVNVVTAASKMS